ncbi:keratin, type II cytoskeletal I-like [Anneissia japonica]|uniref:keratin, type II cytoskeletal I-like n=1 Tax=Anneissia japonica TaxID=1529436 RepID=UPI00142599BB|nr:keratin, type II cytoskeletal I-like [Anneissia japonica]
MQVYFGRNDIPDISIHLSNNRLTVANNVKLLGVVLSSDLKWENHVDLMVKKANRKLFTLRKLKEAGFNNNELLTVYMGYIRPILEYAAPLWSGGLTVYQETSLERVQKRRQVYGCVDIDSVVVGGGGGGVGGGGVGGCGGGGGGGCGGCGGCGGSGGCC